MDILIGKIARESAEEGGQTGKTRRPVLPDDRTQIPGGVLRLKGEGGLTGGHRYPVIHTGYLQRRGAAHIGVPVPHYVSPLAAAGVFQHKELAAVSSQPADKVHR